MLVHTNRSRGLAVLATIGVLACAPVSSASYRNAAHTSPVPSLTAGSRVIDAERIARSGSQTAFDAVRAFVPRHRLDGIAQGSLVADASAASRHVTGVVLDGHPLAELDALRSIPAGYVLAIHILSASDAIVRFGPGYDGGAIVVQTWESLRQR